jgi:hypothetical protein
MFRTVVSNDKTESFCRMQFSIKHADFDALKYK